VSRDRHVRRTKIIATLGPATATPDAIEALMRAGADVLRLNFSHGSREEHKRSIEVIRTAADRLRRPVAILQDLSGPKIRTGRHRDGKPLLLEKGDRLDIRIGDELGEPGMVSTTYAPLAAAVRPGSRLLLDDGRIELVVEAVRGSTIETRVVEGGLLGERKGINAPNVPLPPSGVTPKDEEDLRWGLAAGVDLVALSFVQTAADLERARAIATDAGAPHVPLIAKLERPEAIRRLPEICAAADAVMVARGDLGLELPLEHVPQVQKQVLKAARDHGIPAIVATQVLESMRTEPRPTRAEVSDAAGAVDAGADAIMLSGETAVGAYPIESVETLDAIIRSAEEVPPIWALPPPSAEQPDHVPPLCDAAVTLAARAHVDAIVAITREGRTARLLSTRRPRVPVYAVTDSASRARALCLWWGVEPVVVDLSGENDAAAARAVQQMRAGGRLPDPATVVLVGSSPSLDRSGSNFVRVGRF
jgi:pyruvate kinase